LEEGHNFYATSYAKFAVSSVTSLWQSWAMRSDDWLEVQFSYLHFKPSYVINVLLCAVLWTVARKLVAKKILQPLIRKSSLEERMVVKITELFFNMIAVGLAWIYQAYLTCYYYDLFKEPTKVVYEWRNDVEADWHQCIVHLYQASFYLHRTYASWFEDEWRRDSPVIMIHHVFTFTLLSTGFLYRYFHCGLFVLFLHDLNDALLSASKIFNYLTNKESNNIFAYLSKVTFAVFVYSWYLFRLNWFPLVFLHTTTEIAGKILNDKYPPVFFLNNILLMFLLLMHFYWFKFILAGAWKMATNSKGPIKDDRDIEQHKDKQS